MNAIGATGLVVFTTCPDYAAAEKFYEEVLGLECVYDAIGFKIYSTGGHSFIGIGSRKKEIEPVGALLSICVSDAKTVYDRLHSLGYETTEFYHDKEIPLYTFHVTAPGGYDMEIQEFITEEHRKIFH